MKLIDVPTSTPFPDMIRRCSAATEWGLQDASLKMEQAALSSVVNCYSYL